MQEIVLAASPLLALVGLGPLILGLYLRMGQVEAQLRALDDLPDAQAIGLVAGCMIRSRSCRAALLSLLIACLLFSVLTLGNLAARIAGLQMLEVMPVGLLIAAGLVAMALILTAIEALMALEPLEFISRRKLNAARDPA